MYSQDYDDFYPWGGDPSDLDTNIWKGWKGGKYWPEIEQMKAQNLTVANVMNGYVKNRELWHCPSDDGFDMGGSFEDTPLAAHPSCFAAFGMSYLCTTPLALDHQTISGVRARSRRPPYTEHDPVDVPLFSDHVGHWHGGTTREEERLNFVMVDGHAMNVSRDRADVLDRIQFTVPVPKQ